MCRICTRDRANVQNMIVTFRGGRKRGLHLSLPAQVAAGGHDHQGAGHDVWRLRHTDGCALGKSCRGIRPVAGIPLYGPLSLSGGGSFCAEIPSPGSAVRLPLKGELSSKAAEGFVPFSYARQSAEPTAEFGNSGLWFPNSSLESAAASGSGPCPVGSADMSFPENSGKPEKLGTRIYDSQFRVLPGGSKWLRALPGRQCRHEFSGESRKTEEPSRSDLWRRGSCSIRRQQVEPGTARRRTQPLQYMAAGFVFCPAAANGTGHCPAGGSKWQSALPTGLCIAGSNYAKSVLK